MRKLTQSHITQINVITLQTIAENTTDWLTDPEDVKRYGYAPDIAVVTLALADFNSVKNTEALHNTIMCMDTCIRERFINTLSYIEENALIPVNSYCCV